MQLKNIGRKVLKLNDIAFNKPLGNLIGRSFEMLRWYGFKTPANPR
jgi:hypothetical protein